MFYQSELRKYDQLLKGIANGMKSWISAELDELGGSTDIAEDQYDAMTFRIQNAAMNVEVQNNASCAAIFAEKGVHIVVTRIDEMEHSLGERLRSVHEQVDIYRAKLQKENINHFICKEDNHHGINHILSLSAALNQHLFGKFLWRYFVALHNRKWFLMYVVKKFFL
ncbi:hypothetical protein niasHT_037352 [Heterodera trifolii]|uniref:Uncharacterized protein n=1 Tax=Heterodera trifolii TaxID=157864 RepID=A0ABD2J218_9BILA